MTMKTPIPKTDDIIEAYSRFFPENFIKLIGKEHILDVKLGDHIEKTMTILFSDIRDFTSLSEGMTPKESFAFINSYLEKMEPAIANTGGIIDKYIGDAVMVLFPNNADSALRCAVEMLSSLKSFNSEWQKSGHRPINIGIGLNTGLMMLGIIGGRYHMESTVISDAVNLASRIESMTKEYKTPVLMSEHTYYSLIDQEGFHIRFIDRVKVKGKEQCQSVYEVFDGDPPSLKEAKTKTKNIFEEALANYHLKKIPEAMELLDHCVSIAPDDSVARIYLNRCQRFIDTGIHESSGEVGLVLHWDGSLAIGDPLIDGQHKSLFDHAGAFVEAVARANDYSELTDIVKFLNDYIDEHFTTEEQLMGDSGYPFLDYQIEQHRQFSKSFRLFQEEIKKDLDRHRIFLLFRAQILIIDWLVNHTSKIDKHLGVYLRHRNH
ncbi:MAG: hemerythrin domain-containing protein [Syntrophorhabdaceae bacterium]|nr:hemerythrin domain-containing protein [Syntrophorhabdaceae bacterium]